MTIKLKICAAPGQQTNPFASIRQLGFLLGSLVLLTLFISETHAQTDGPVKSDRYERLANFLTNTRWTGQFTVNSDDDRAPQEEQYEILQATKAEEGDYWNLIARIKYADKDLTLPLPPLEIKWAGETPVITVDQVTIPGMGTFDARVVIRHGHYAGLWSHDKVGGHLFGKIEKLQLEPSAESERPDEDKPQN